MTQHAQWKKGWNLMGDAKTNLNEVVSNQPDEKIIIQSDKPTDTRIYKHFQVKPNQPYLVSVRAKGENIIGGTIGANISVHRSSLHSNSLNGGTGNFEGLLTLPVVAPSSGIVPISLRLGWGGSQVTGKVEFENLQLIPDTYELVEGSSDVSINQTKNLVVRSQTPSKILLKKQIIIDKKTPYRLVLPILEHSIIQQCTLACYVPDVFYTSITLDTKQHEVMVDFEAENNDSTCLYIAIDDNFSGSIVFGPLKILLNRWTFLSEAVCRDMSHNSTRDGILTLIHPSNASSGFVRGFYTRSDVPYVATVRVQFEGEVSNKTKACISQQGVYSSSSVSTSSTLSLHFLGPCKDITLFLRGAGKVIFSDFQIFQDRNAVIVSGEHVNLYLPSNLASTIDPALATSLVEQLNMTYKAMQHLYGTTPYGGNSITVCPTQGLPGWALAGQRIMWQQGACMRHFQEMSTKPKKWCPGLMHELGHDFDMSFFGSINKESMANINAQYANEKLGMPLGDALSTQNDYSNRYTQFITKKQWNHDGFVYIILRTARAIGWEPFEQVMRDVIQRKITCPRDKGTLIEFWMNSLQQKTYLDIKSTFPPGEYDFLINNRNFGSGY